MALESSFIGSSEAEPWEASMVYALCTPCQNMVCKKEDVQA